MPEIWFPGAERLPGPSRKTSGTSWPKQGACFHSSEGSLAGALAVLQDLRPNPNGSLPGSWHFTNAKDGRLYQHYSLDVVAWHARGGNKRTFGVENEGTAGELLTKPQIANLAGVTAWAKPLCGWGELSRAEADRNLWEHNEIGLLNNYITACPSRRLRKAWVRIIVLAEKILEGDDDMATEQERKDRATASAWFEQVAAHTAQGIVPPKEAVNAVLYYATVWKRQAG